MPADARSSSAQLPARRPFRSAPRRGRRQHGQVQQFDRCELERSGWRTTLDYQENHVRGRDGRLEQLQVVWRAEAERMQRDGATHVVTATGSTPGKAWSRLRAEADLADLRSRRGDAARATVTASRRNNGQLV